MMRFSISVLNRFFDFKYRILILIKLGTAAINQKLILHFVTTLMFVCNTTYHTTKNKMKKLIGIFILLLILSCSKDKIDPEIEKGLLKNQSILIGNTNRNYHLYIPNNPTNASVVFLFHGNGGSYDDMVGLTNLKAPYKIWINIALQENLIIVVPNGILGSSNSRGWNDCRNDASTNPTSNDVQFTNELLDFIKGKYNSNNQKVYAVGTSNGGHFAIRLAQEIPNRITAFASVVAANSVNSQCTNSNIKVSALFMNGTDDPIMPYIGGQMASNRGEVFSTDNTVTYWTQRNATLTTPEITDIPNTNAVDGSTVKKYLYKNGGNGTEVALYKVISGGHTEPSVMERYSSLFLTLVGNQNGDIEMANEIWNFFKTKTK
jgi:polyhydroxybutyrate depolymerase